MASLKPFPATIKAACRLDGLVYREVHYADDFGMPSHTHEEAHLFLCLAGTLRHDCRKESRFLTPSMLAFLPEGEPHANGFHDGVRTFDIVLKPSWVTRRQEYAPLCATAAEHQNSPPVWLASRLYQEFRRRDNLTPLMLEGLTLELLAQLSRYAPDYGEARTPRWLQQTRDFLHAHFTETFALDAVAAAVNRHPDHLTRAFRQRFHCTIGDYVRRLRVEYACHLLSASEASLSQIALDSGFADQSHFHRNFKNRMGMTPAEYRKAAGRADSSQPMLS